MQIAPAVLQAGNVCPTVLSVILSAVVGSPSATTEPLLILTSCSQAPACKDDDDSKGQLTQAAPVAAHTHTHTQGHTYVRTLSFIHSCQGQEQGDKCCPTVRKKCSRREEPSRAEQSEGGSGKSYARHFQQLSLNQARIRHTTPARSESARNKQAEGAGEGGLWWTRRYAGKTNKQNFNIKLFAVFFLVFSKYHSAGAHIIMYTIKSNKYPAICNYSIQKIPQKMLSIFYYLKIPH